MNENMIHENIKKEIHRSFDRFHLSASDQERMTKRLQHSNAEETNSLSTFTEKGGITMQNRKWKRAILIAAALTIMVAGASLASGTIVQLFSGSHAGYDFKKYEDYDKAIAKAGVGTVTPETLAGEFKFAGVTIADESGRDETGQTLREWKSLQTDYKNEDKQYVTVVQMDEINAFNDNAAPQRTAEIAGTTVAYTQTDTMFVPPNYEVSEADLERAETDPYFTISYGTDEVEYSQWRSLTFVKDNVFYHLLTSDADEETLFTMAEEILTQSN